MIKYLLFFLLVVIIGLIFYKLEQRPLPLNKQLNNELNKIYKNEKPNIMKIYEERIDMINSDNKKDLTNTKETIKAEQLDYKKNNKTGLDFTLSIYTNEINNIKKNNDALMNAKIATFNLDMNKFSNDYIIKQEKIENTKKTEMENIINTKYNQDIGKIKNILRITSNLAKGNTIIPNNLNVSGKLEIQNKDVNTYLSDYKTILNNKAVELETEVNTYMDTIASKKLPSSGGNINNIKLPTTDLLINSLKVNNSGNSNDINVNNIKIKDWNTSQRCQWYNAGAGPDAYADYTFHKSICPIGSYMAGLRVFASDVLDGNLLSYCCKFNT